MQINKNKHYDVIFIGLGVSAIIFYLQHYKKFKGKSICFIDKLSRFDLNKTISGFASDIPLPVLKSFSKFNCQFGEEVKSYETRIPYHILNLKQIFEDFQGKTQDCDFIFNSLIINVKREAKFIIDTGEMTFTAGKVFDSRAPKLESNNILRQHFLGWFVRFSSEHKISDPMLMDIDQESKDFCFTYIIPLSMNEALIELTYFGPQIFSKEQYEKTLKAYMDNKFKEMNYEVYNEESGAIPLLNIIPEFKVKDYHSLGIRNGYLRASTGYSVFQSLFEYRPNTLLQVMDEFLLKVLWISPDLGAKIFTIFLKKMNGDTLANFMSYRPSFFSILRAVLAMPKLIFIKHLFRSSNGLRSRLKLRGMND